MKIDDEIRKTEIHLSKLKDLRRREVPSLDNFKMLASIRFADCIDCLPKISHKYPLETYLLIYYCFYAGRIYEDADQTGLYKGPAIHRVKTIMTKYISHLRDLSNYSINPQETMSIRQAYSDLNSLGLNHR